MAKTDQSLLVVQGVSKRFGITQALSDVSVTFRAGEVHALMGENGAGKSTLGKAIAGLHAPDTGSISIEGHALKPGSIDDAFGRGIRIVHQELAQCPNLSVAENLCLHDMPTTALGTVNYEEMARRAERLVHRLDPTINVRAPLGILSAGRRQICQIAASLEDEGEGGSSPKVIVFDEPTSSLSVAETDRLLEIVRELANEGITIIYVSHRMGEIFACCDRVTVLRDGKYVATNEVKEIDEPTLVEQMIGRRIETPKAGEHGKRAETVALRAMVGTDDEPHETGRVMLEVKGLTSPGKIRDVSLQVRAGEVLGIGGLVGAGRSETLEAIFGLDTRATGSVSVDGKPLPIGKPRDAIAARMGFVPEDRRNQGLFFQLGVDENILVPYMPALSSLPFLGGVRNSSGEHELVGNRLKRFQVKTASPKSTPGELSGGNQQKLLIARWMAQDTKVLLLDEPTRGIDVGTKAEVYKLVREAADQGLAVLLVSSEMPELLALSDRVIVLAEGRVTGELEGDEMTQSKVLTLATIEENSHAAV